MAEAWYCLDPALSPPFPLLSQSYAAPLGWWMGRRSVRAHAGRRRESGNFGNRVTGPRCQPQVEKLLGRPSLLVQGGLLSVEGGDRAHVGR